MLIYLIRNLVNGKVYIGQTTVSLEKRWEIHQQKGCSRLFSAIKHYGKSGFSITQLCSASSQEELDALEKYYICAYNSTDLSIGYNVRDGGARGKHSEETKAKIGLANKLKLKGRSLSPQHKANVIAAIKRRTPEQVQKQLSAACIKNLGRKPSQAGIERIKASNRARVVSPSTIQKMRDSHLGFKPTQATRAKLSLARLGRSYPPEHCANIRLGRRAGIEKRKQSLNC